jgi:quercetin dioxygenase-like cupin family protein
VRVLAALVASLALAPSLAKAQDMSITISRAGARPSVTGSPENFIGSVRVDSGFQRPAPARIGGGIVTFEPGARTNWHTHPLGQTLIVTAGAGLVGSWGGGVEEIRPGDVVWIPPGVKHWHGAAAATAMSHIAIAESLDGSAVAWMERVSDAQYRGGNQ